MRVPALSSAEVIRQKKREKRKAARVRKAQKAQRMQAAKAESLRARNSAPTFWHALRRKRKSV